MSASYAFEVRVQPQYLSEQSDPTQGRYVFAYQVTIRNVGDMAAQLISRHWIITDARGQVEEVQGLGVVGQQPLLQPGESFEYTSGCPLRTPRGTMQGSYFFVAVDGSRFDVEIPIFVLAAEGSSAASQHLH